MFLRKRPLNRRLKRRSRGSLQSRRRANKPCIEQLEDRRLLSATAVEVPDDSSVKACYADTEIATESQAPSTEDATVVGAEQGKSGMRKGGKKPSRAAISVSPVNPSAGGLQTTETGGSDEFQVALKTEPTADVMLQMFSDDSTEGELDKSSLTFTSANWNTPQIVTVTGVDDLDPDGNVDYLVVLEPATSADPDYNDLDPADVELTNIDDETSETEAIYVRDFFVDEPRQRGPHTDFRFIVDAGLGTNDTDAAGAQVVVSVYDSSDTDLNNDSNIRNFLGTTDSNGIYRTPWLKGLDPGTYWVEVHDLALAGYLWERPDDLDLELDQDGDGRRDLELIVD